MPLLVLGLLALTFLTGGLHASPASSREIAALDRQDKAIDSLSAAANVPPSIQKQPEDVTVRPQESATFQVSAAGSSPLAYQWRLDGAPLADAQQASLTIPNATSAWTGGYDVVVRNAFGAITSRVAQLVVRLPNLAERAREEPGPSSRRTALVITEIHHHPEPRTDGRRTAFIELYNSNPFFEELGGWRLEGWMDFTFPSNTVIGGNSYLVIAQAPDDLRALHGLTNVIGAGGVRPARSEDSVRLRKKSGALVLEVPFADRNPWPAASFGAGHSMVLLRPSLGERQANAWWPSALIGGSPGRSDAIPTAPSDDIVFVEFLPVADGATAPFLELLNQGLTTVDLSGYHLREVTSGLSHRIPDGTRIRPRTALSVAPAELTNWPRTGTVGLLRPDESRVIDAFRFVAREPGRAIGRDTVDPRRAWRELESATPGGPNAAPTRPAVVLNEILYHPPSERDDDEFIELHNPGANTVDLAGWRFTEGVDFTFPEGSRLSAGAHAVVVPDLERFVALHPTVPRERIFGNYRGQLSDGGEPLALARPVAGPEAQAALDRRWAIVDEVHYLDGGAWGRWSDGGGSSLEAVEARTDRRESTSWADSEEAQRAPWTTLENTGVLNLSHPGVPRADQLQVILLGAGEVLLDDVEVLVNGENRIANSTFRNGSNGWVAQGTHRLSRWEPSEGFDDGASYRMVASDRGDHVANRVRSTLSSTIPNGTTVTLRARIRWLKGHPEILLRLRNGALEAAGRLELPPFAGTPAAPNSRARPNAPPAILDVRHDPLLPAANQPVRVLARIQDPDGIGDVRVRFRLDPQTTLTDLPMVDDGSGPDEVAGDGIYTVEIPGRSAGTLMAFRVLATDASGPAAAGPVTAIFPPDAPDHEGLIRFGETPIPGAFGTYRLWMTRAAHDRWAAREKMSNEDVPVTFIAGTTRVIYQAGAHYSGSSYTAPIYTSPTGNLCGYNIRLPESETYLGATQLTLDWPIRDDTDQREQLMYWFLEQLNLPNMYRRYVHLVVNGVRRGTIYDDIEQPNRDSVGAWFSPDDEGSLWKTDCWNEFDNAGNRIDPCVLNTLQRFPPTGPLKVARYRWNWRPRAVRGSANDFSDLFALVDAVTTTSNYLDSVERTIDIDHWMRTFAMNDLASFWDAFGNPNAKNTFLYKPERDRWKLMSWDFDVGLGVFNDPTDAPLFDVGDPALQKMYRTPALVRRYWAALEESLNTFFRVGAGTPIETRLDSRYAAFRTHNVGLAAPTAIKSWIRTRRSFLLSQLNTVRATFAITTRGGADFSTDQEQLDLAGMAPVGVRWLAVGESVREPTWSTVTNWTTRLLLRPGMNTLRVIGLDRDQQPIPGAEDTIHVQFTGVPSPPPALRINEWMAANRSTLTDPADGDFEDWFEVYNADAKAVDLTGFSFTDDPAAPRRFVVATGPILAPGSFLTVWADGEPEQTSLASGLHTNFRLDRTGSALAIFDPLGRPVDAVRFGPQATDISEGRWPDGSTNAIVALSSPSPGTRNPQPSAPPILLASHMERGGESWVMVIEWSAVAGLRYRVEERRGWTTHDGWTPFSSDLIAEGSTARFQIPIPATSEERFFRVMLALP